LLSFDGRKAQREDRHLEDEGQGGRQKEAEKRETHASRGPRDPEEHSLGGEVLIGDGERAGDHAEREEAEHHQQEQ